MGSRAFNKDLAVARTVEDDGPLANEEFESEDGPKKAKRRRLSGSVKKQQKEEKCERDGEGASDNDLPAVVKQPVAVKERSDTPIPPLPSSSSAMGDSSSKSSDGASVAKRSPAPTSGPLAHCSTTGSPAPVTPLRIVNPEHFPRMARSASPNEFIPISRRHSTEFPGSDFGVEHTLDPFPVPLASPRHTSSNHLPEIKSIGSKAFQNGENGDRFSNGQTVKVPCSAKKQKRTKLHQAVVAGTLTDFQETLAGMTTEQDIDACDPDSGYSALMSAAATEDQPRAEAMCSALIARGADVHTADAEGFSALHWAAAMGNVGAIKALLKAGGDLQAQSLNGDTPLHRAARFGRLECISALVKDHRANTSITNAADQSPLDVCGGFCVNRNLTKHLSGDARKAFFAANAKLKTLVLHHNECLGHRTSQAHQEAPERCVMILDKVTKGIQPEFVHVSTNFPSATRNQLKYAHCGKYIEFVYDLHNKVKRIGSPVPFTPRVQRMNGAQQVKDESGCDTFFSEGSLPAALRAVGAVCNAVDRVIGGYNPNAFCIVRPPGHHAGVAGLLDNAISCGFCIFNNVAIAARHALETYPDKIRRIAIVDFDVHHGNGTEEIVRDRFKDPNGMFFFSIHLYDKPEGAAVGTGEFYPGSGEKDVKEFNVVNAPLTPMWRVPSTSKTRSKGKKSPKVVDGASLDGGCGCSGSATAETPKDEAQQQPGDPELARLRQMYGRQAFRENITLRLIPGLRQFQPDLIFISAGFDAGKNDIGCSKTEKGKYYSGIDLLPEDYFWVTKQIQTVARECCQGRVISALEGGYGVWSRSKPSGPGQPRKLVLNREQLGENALAHCKALVL